jgi:chemotaxis protein CheD
MPNAILEKQKAQSVGMGELVVATGPACLSSILGSCVGLVLFHPRRQIGGLAHVVLPKAEGRLGGKGKFADLAVPEMLRQIAALGGNRAGLVAKLFGGASMFSGTGPLQIGISNEQAVRAALEIERIPVVAADLGGIKGRMIHFHCETGQVRVEIAGRLVNLL